MREYYLHKSALNDRIYAGKLAYYDYASHNITKEIKMKNENTKRRLSLSSNLAVVFDKNDVSSMKALTTKKFYNYKKNFVDINRRIYYNSNKNKDEEKNELQLIRESPDNKKNNKKMTKKNLKINLNIYNTFNKIKNANKLKRKYFSFINNYTINKEINNPPKKQPHASSTNLGHIIKHEINRNYIKMKSSNNITKNINHQNLLMRENNNLKPNPGVKFTIRIVNKLNDNNISINERKNNNKNKYLNTIETNMDNQININYEKNKEYNDELDIDLNEEMYINKKYSKKNFKKFIFI